MRFLLINSIGRNKWGGGEKWMLLAAQGLKQLGHDVFIACFSRSIIEQKALTLGIRVLPINIYTDFSVTGYFAIKKIVQQHQIDLIIGCQNKDVRLSGLVARKLGYPVVISRQGVQLLHNSFKYRCGFKPFCDGIITNTISIKEEYDSYGWWDNDYVKVIHNGVETSNQITSTFDYTTYIKPTSSQKPFIVLSTGRITTQKGFVYLIEAAEPIIQQHPHVHFFIAGKGKLQAGLEALVKRKGLADNIHFIGFHENVTGLV